MESQAVSESGTAGSMLIRLLRPSIVVLCGPAACGKSTFARQHFRPTQIVSSDWARACVCDDERDQRFNAQAFALVNFIAEQRMIANRLCVIDSTALTVQARRDLVDLARKYQVPTTLLLFNAPLESCIDRDEKRERSVGRAVIERHHRAYEQTRATIDQEGFNQVFEIPDGDQEKVQIEILFRPVMRPQRPEGESNRRPERSGQGYRAHQNKPGDNGHALVASPAAADARPATPPRPSANHVAVPVPRSGVPAVSVTRATAASVAHVSSTPSTAPPAGSNEAALLATAHVPSKSGIDKPQKLTV